MNKFRGFIPIIEDLKKYKNLIFYRPEPISEELLLKVHTRSMLNTVKSYHNYEPSLYASQGCVDAVCKVWSGEIDNAFVFFGCCHHAGRNHAWGGCAISGIGPAVYKLREMGFNGKICIFDTDAHHGDGTRDIFMGDKDVLHICFCGMDNVEDDGTKIDVAIPWNAEDEEYMTKVKELFLPKVEEFRPDMIIHIVGHDTARGDYGGCNLSNDFFLDLVRLVKNTADRISKGRYIILTGGGSRSDVAEYIYPRIIKILAEIE